MTEFATKLMETARALGMDPRDLATIISYETGGTFDPMQAGPTTQYGQHKGLIQFGEPQAQQYGVNWDDPLNSQLGENGAVANYFRDNGYKPGMGLLDAYSIVNAGGPGRYSASDANNGGAPGTVADKVNSQMSGHMANADRLFKFDTTQFDTTQNGINDLPYSLGEDVESPWASAAGILGKSFMAQSTPEAPEIAQRQVQQYVPQRRDYSSLLNFFSSLR